MERLGVGSLVGRAAPGKSIYTQLRLFLAPTIAVIAISLTITIRDRANITVTVRKRTAITTHAALLNYTLSPPLSSTRCRFLHFSFFLTIYAFYFYQLSTRFGHLKFIFTLLLCLRQFRSPFRQVVK